MPSRPTLRRPRSSAPAALTWVLPPRVRRSALRGRLITRAAGTVLATAIALVTALAVPATAGPWPDPRPQGDRMAELLRSVPLPVDGDPSSLTVLVNKQRPLPLDYVPTTLVPVDDGRIELRPEAAEALAALRAAAASSGITPTLLSGYRSAARQQEVYDGWVSGMGTPGADEVSARAGHSEHQTGLAVDLGSSTRPECDLSPCFADTVEAAWLTAHAEDYGFVIRYTAENQARTGYRPEGWHLRYVGPELITELRTRHATSLEQLYGAPGGPHYGP